MENIFCYRYPIFIFQNIYLQYYDHHQSQVFLHYYAIDLFTQLTYHPFVLTIILFIKIFLLYFFMCISLFTFIFWGNSVGPLYLFSRKQGIYIFDVFLGGPVLLFNYVSEIIENDINRDRYYNPEIVLQYPNSTLWHYPFTFCIDPGKWVNFM